MTSERATLLCLRIISADEHGIHCEFDDAIVYTPRIIRNTFTLGNAESYAALAVAMEIVKHVLPPGSVYMQVDRQGEIDNHFDHPLLQFRDYAFLDLIPNILQNQALDHGEWSEMAKALEEARVAVESSCNDLDKANEIISGLEDQVATLNDELDEMTKAKEELEAEKQDLQDRLDDIDGTLRRRK